MRKTRVLVLIDWFRPGFKAGGPIQTVANLVCALQEDIEWFILTSDKDFGESNPYPGIESGTWTDWEGKAWVWYCRSDEIPSRLVVSFVAKIKPDVVYFNSLFSPGFTLAPLRSLKRLKKRPRLVLAPRGMLNPGALALKKWKKKAFLLAARATRFFSGVEFQATFQQEKEAIHARFGQKVRVHLVPNLPSADLQELVMLPKEPGNLKLVFLGRISRMKNLDFLLNVLRQVKFQCELSITGPREDEVYLKMCENLGNALPTEVTVTWNEGIRPEEVVSRISEGHLYVLPTLGENFGHSIFEAFLAGRPVLISDLTPWRNLAPQGLGWDLPLSNPEKWSEVLNEAAAWDQAEFEKRARVAHQFAANYLKRGEDRQKSLNLFVNGS
ncbi:MAG: glycosyltransferase [Bacteroidia bacterium]|nr:glycosyltransferase [Bacteroidia bacterium]